MTFNEFPLVNITDEEAVEFLIDEPVVGDMIDYTIIEVVLPDELP